MAVDKLVDSSQLDADLTSVANAIRTKGGTSASLAFPADFVSAIGAIPSGGSVDWSGLVKGTWPTGAVVLDSTVTSIPIRKFTGFSGITSVSAPAVTMINENAFDLCTALTSVDFPEAIEIKGYGFASTNQLEVAHFPKVTTINSQCFARGSGTAPGLTLVLPALTTFNSDSLRAGRFDAIDLGPNLSQIPARGIYGTNANHYCTILILRKTDSIVTLANATNAVACGEITVYVPSALKSTYESNTNWASLVSNNKVVFATIEGSAYETKYADGTSIS